MGHGASVQGLRGDEIGIISPYAAQVVGFRQRESGGLKLVDFGGASCEYTTSC